jgi:hypothetical protein
VTLTDPDERVSRALSEASAHRITWLLTALLGVVTVVVARDAWFVYDDLVILGPRHETLHLDGVMSLLQPYNGHLMAGLMAGNLAFAHVFGLDDYLPWLLAVLVGNIVAVWVARRVMVTLGVRVMVASVAAPLLMLWGPLGWTLFWGPESAFLVAVALCSCQLLLSLDTAREPGRPDVVGAAVAVIAVLIHSSAVLGPVVVVAALLARRRPLRAAVAAVPGLVFGLWLVTIGTISGVTSTPSIGDVENRGPVRFAGRLVAGPLHDLLPDALAAVAVIVMVVGGLRLTERTAGPARVLARCCVAQAVLTIVVLARGRSGAIADLSQAGRYVAVVSFLLLPLCVLVVQHVIDRVARRWVATLVWCAVSAVAIVPNGAAALEDAAALERRGSVNRATLEALAADERLDGLPADHPIPVWRQLDAGDVRRLRDEGLLSRATSVDAATRRWLDMNVFTGQD